MRLGNETLMTLWENSLLARWHVWLEIQEVVLVRLLVKVFLWDWGFRHEFTGFTGGEVKRNVTQKGGWQWPMRKAVPMASHENSAGTTLVQMLLFGTSPPYLDQV